MNPIKPSFKTEVLPILAMLVMLIASFYFYQRFPDQVPTHWNFAGEVDAYSSRAVGAFLMPLVALGIYLMFFVFPYLDPKKERYEQFRKVFHIFKNLLILFLLAIYFLAAASALGYEVNIGLWVSAMVGLLFVVLGNYFGKIKPNWFMGIRTPWTLSSEEVWNKTHRFGGKVFILGGFFLAILTLIPDSARAYLFIGVILFMVVAPMAYSYVIFNKIKQKNEDHK